MGSSSFNEPPVRTGVEPAGLAKGASNYGGKILRRKCLRPRKIASRAPFPRKTSAREHPGSRPLFRTIESLCARGNACEAAVGETRTGWLPSKT